jgi:bifunctional non-homologous end joining protein LigD
MKLLKPMLPTLVTEPPLTDDWLYEVKYDGFRGLLFWSHEKIELLSRNGKALLPLFPEIAEWLETFSTKAAPFFPLVFDGEITILDNDVKGSFEAIQQRGRLRSPDRITHLANGRPAHYLVFDLLKVNGEWITNQSFLHRKDKLRQLFTELGWPIDVSRVHNSRVQYIPFSPSFSAIWDRVDLFQGEGIVAKKKSSSWEAGKRSSNWKKIKRKVIGTCFITAFDETNDYYTVAVFAENHHIETIGQVKHGFSKHNEQTLKEVIRLNGNKQHNLWTIHPSICIDISYLEQSKQQLREPSFERFRLDFPVHQCTITSFRLQQLHLPDDVNITHPEKVIWPLDGRTKLDYLHYLREMAPFMLPFLHNRPLTVVRYPDGVDEESFFQKNCPSYAPSFIQTVEHDGQQMMVCQGLKELIWLGNQVAIEFHTPFHHLSNEYVSEIVLDLDPPSEQAFPLAIHAALLLKEKLDEFGLISFVKYSGKKGLQIYVPLPLHTYRWGDTAPFLKTLAEWLVSQHPDWFTTERMKERRGDRLYVDYVQHHRKKTIISPYSVRGTPKGRVAAPLFWEELKESFQPDQFTMDFVRERVKKIGCPFQQFDTSRNKQPFEPIRQFFTNGLS